MTTWAASGFVGRRAELRELLRCLQQAVAGRGRLVVVTGEGGIGKTRLCEELADAAGGLGAGVGWATCWESGGGPPFGPWWRLLDQLGVRVEPAGREDARDVARARLFTSVWDAVAAAARQRPRLLVLDDAQWADAGTLALLGHGGPLLRSTGVLLVVTVRRGEIGSSALPAGLLRSAQVIGLDGLYTEELAELVVGLTGSPPPPQVEAALHRATGGNPLFAAELVRRLHRERRLDRLALDGPVPVSPTVRAVLDEQLADLGGGCRALLEVGAVVGGEFGLWLLAAVAGRERLDVAADVEQAVAAGVLVVVGVGRYAFAHPLLRSVVHDDIGVAHRVRLHERIGWALETDAGGEPDLAALSFHYLNAATGGTEAAGKAVRYAGLAAQAAMTALGYEAAVELYDRALAVTELDRSRR